MADILLTPVLCIRISGRNTRWCITRSDHRALPGERVDLAILSGLLDFSLALHHRCVL
ncbi:MAG: hypothetical protein GDA36_12805 [Rhodobacteraceae bacterium]|nr:hypothetical protein [Paracoccaceae bacterium]